MPQLLPDASNHRASSYQPCVAAGFARSRGNPSYQVPSYLFVSAPGGGTTISYRCGLRFGDSEISRSLTLFLFAALFELNIMLMFVCFLFSFLVAVSPC